MKLPLKPISQSRRAFTLIELLVVIAVIAILAAILIPAVGAVRASADNAVGVSNLRQVAGAIQMYAADHNNRIVPVKNQNPGVSMDWRETLYLGGYLDGETREIDGDEDVANTWTTFPVLGNPAHYKKYPENPLPEPELTDPTRATFAMNVRLGYRAPQGGPNPPGHFGAGSNFGLESPAKTFLVGDGRYDPQGAGQDSGYANVVWPAAHAFFEPVYKGSVNIAYADGHIVSMEIDEIPSSEAVGDYRTFWRGVPR